MFVLLCLKSFVKEREKEKKYIYVRVVGYFIVITRSCSVHFMTSINYEIN